LSGLLRFAPTRSAIRPSTRSRLRWGPKAETSFVRGRPKCAFALARPRGIYIQEQTMEVML
jgi:hypothetical protein